MSVQQALIVDLAVTSSNLRGAGPRRDGGADKSSRCRDGDQIMTEAVADGTPGIITYGDRPA
jgi:hypothetical protein